MSELMAGKVVLVTGGSSGIGRAAALAFAGAGAKVVTASRSEERGRAVEQLIRETGGDCTWVQADVSRADQVEHLLSETIRLYGRLDCAFNNGGSGGRGGWTHEIAEEDWDLTVDGYLKSVWLCMKFEIRQMLEQGGGAIVNNSSVDGLRAFPFDPIYSAAKHGVIGLTKSAAVQYARQGVRINAVCPGWILTEPVKEMLAHDPNSEQMMLNHQPIGRLGAAEEVAQAVLWLCSDHASLIVGASVPVDGGYQAV
jgi:NAD(P)-dependent dehydrogenase (short-subunit alcohol dehydrogenase family)